MMAKRGSLLMLAACWALACCASGCVYKPVQMGGPLFGSEELKGRKLVKVAEGEACSSHILYVIPVGDDGMEAALARLNKKTGWMSDVVTVEQGQMFWLVGWSNCTRIIGYSATVPATKFKTTLLSEAASPPPAAATKAPAAEPAAETPAGDAPAEQ